MFMEHQDQYRQRMRDLTAMNPFNAMRDAMNLWDPKHWGRKESDDS